MHNRKKIELSNEAYSFADEIIEVLCETVSGCFIVRHVVASVAPLNFGVHATVSVDLLARTPSTYKYDCDLWGLQTFQVDFWLNKLFNEPEEIEFFKEQFLSALKDKLGGVSEQLTLPFGADMAGGAFIRKPSAWGAL